jgi:hypothetical protein
MQIDGGNLSSFFCHLLGTPQKITYAVLDFDKYFILLICVSYFLRCPLDDATISQLTELDIEVVKKLRSQT